MSKIGECACCGETKKIQAHGWCIGCYTRWYRAGQPSSGPPPCRRVKVDEAMIEDVRWLLETGSSLEEAAARVGVKARTLRKRVLPPEPVECAVRGCAADAYPRASRGQPRCAEHRNGAAVYAAFRASGLNRKKAALAMGVTAGATYSWEAGEPGQGRPRKNRALEAA